MVACRPSFSAARTSRLACFKRFWPLQPARDGRQGHYRHGLEGDHHERLHQLHALRIPLTSRSGECQRGLANTHAHTYALLTMHALIHAPIPYARNSHTRQPEPALHTSQPTCHLCHVTLTCPRSSAHLPRFWTMSHQGQAPPSPPAQMARRAHARSFGSAVRPQPALHTTLLSTLLSRLTCPAPRTPGSLFLKCDRIIRTQTDLN